MNDIEVLNQMGKNNKEIYLFPLENIRKLDIRPVRSMMEMIIDSGVARKIQDGEMVGAFIVADREQFYKIKNGKEIDDICNNAEGCADCPLLISSYNKKIHCLKDDTFPLYEVDKVWKRLNAKIDLETNKLVEE